MASDLIIILSFFLALIACITLYLVIVNILKFALTFRFISKIIYDFKKRSKEYKESKLHKNWQPWKYE